MKTLPKDRGILPSMPSMDALPPRNESNETERNETGRNETERKETERKETERKERDERNERKEREGNENQRNEDEVTASLVARARGGDQEAWSRLVETHVGRVWRVVWKVVRHDQDAEDVAQEVFLTAWQSLADFRGDARFSTWLHTIAVTRALNHLDRAAERMRRASEPLAHDAEAEEGQEIGARVERAAARVHSGAPSPLEQLAAGELMLRLTRCLEKLPGAWRAVLAMREAEDRSYEEIAAALQLAIGTVRSRLARARIALKDCVEGSAS